MTDYTERHMFEADKEWGSDTRGNKLCICGLPSDNPLHIQEEVPPEEVTIEERLKRLEIRMDTIWNEIFNASREEWPSKKRTIFLKGRVDKLEEALTALQNDKR